MMFSFARPKLPQDESERLLERVPFPSTFYLSIAIHQHIPLHLRRRPSLI
jgi:hypothetical protein